MHFRLGEFFSGPGGLAEGAKLAQSADGKWKISHAWATDYDLDTCKTYAWNHTNNDLSTVFHRDIRTLDYSELEIATGVEAIDGFAFGFPCNDFSLVGSKKGLDGEFGPLYKYGVKALKRWKPKWFVAENVSGLTSSGAFDLILEELREAGYLINAHLYKFEEYGVPQARRRVIIVGIRKDQSVRFRVPSTEEFKSVDISARTALSDIPSWASSQEPTRQSKTVISRLMHIKPGENAWNASIPEHLKLNVQGAKLSHIYKRLDPSKPSYTVTGSGGGGTHIYHWAEPRALTNRERARLQTFSDTYRFFGSKESVRKQIGMAVPPKGAKIIFDAILNSFAGIEYPSVDASLAED